MASAQSRHVVPCKKYDKLLYGNGMDKVMAEIISDDFAFKAKGDGKVIEFDDKTGVMVLQYKDGEYDFVELYPKIEKNGGGGFFVSNKLETKYTVGMSFKEGDVIASNSRYFDGSDDGSATFKVGTLTKVALAQGYYTYEDSSMISNKLSKDMATEVIMKKDVVLGKNSNIDYIVNVGDKVEVGSPLIIFDNSYDDEGINKMFAAMGDEIGQELSELGKKKVKSKYSGIIEDIRVYYTVDPSELSESVQKAIKTINKSVLSIKNKVSKYKKLGETNLILPSTDKVDTQYGKVKGVSVGDGVYIEFYIKYYDEIKIGDKIILKKGDVKLF